MTPSWQKPSLDQIRGLWSNVWLVAYGTDEFPIRLRPPNPARPPPQAWFAQFSKYVVDDSKWYEVYSCHVECAPGGCTGPGADQCLGGCRHFATQSRLGLLSFLNTWWTIPNGTKSTRLFLLAGILDFCTQSSAFFFATNVYPCHVECAPGGCTGPGADQCLGGCRHFATQSRLCVATCPRGTTPYGALRVTIPAHSANWNIHSRYRTRIKPGRIRSSDVGQSSDSGPSNVVCQPCWTLCASCLRPHTEYDCTSCSNGRYLVPLITPSKEEYISSVTDQTNRLEWDSSIELPSLVGTCRTECPVGFYASKNLSTCIMLGLLSFLNTWWTIPNGTKSTRATLNVLRVDALDPGLINVSEAVDILPHKVVVTELESNRVAYEAVTWVNHLTLDPAMWYANHVGPCVLPVFDLTRNTTVQAVQTDATWYRLSLPSKEEYISSVTDQTNRLEWDSSIELPSLVGTCRTECPVGFYASKNLSTCIMCIDNCAKCVGPRIGECLLCTPGFRLIHGRCVHGQSVDGRCSAGEFSFYPSISRSFIMWLSGERKVHPDSST
ncbi:hypothetical protein AHF37_07077 [Paragonimus kellicotti]|nr:hypothetical protein AHF37_07077 [Paragonimus kellicotti]